VLVGEATLEVRLESEGAGDNVPGAILLLRAEDEVHSAAVDGMGRHHAGLMQRPERFARSERVRLVIVGLAPAAIGALFADEFFHTASGGGVASPD
jgi:hypothetical protein